MSAYNLETNWKLLSVHLCMLTVTCEVIINMEVEVDHTLLFLIGSVTMTGVMLLAIGSL